MSNLPDPVINEYTRIKANLFLMKCVNAKPGDRIAVESYIERGVANRLKNTPQYQLDTALMTCVYLVKQKGWADVQNERGRAADDFAGEEEEITPETWATGSFSTEEISLSSQTIE